MIVLALIGALIIGLTLRLIGSGGSILTVPLLVLLLHRPEKLAIAESLAIIALIGLAGAISCGRRHQIHWKSFFFFGLPGMLGAGLGAHFSSFLTVSFQLFLFSLLMFVVAGVIFFIPIPRVQTIVSKDPLQQTATLSPLSPVLETPVPIFSIMTKGFLIGGLTGLMGVGGGFLIVPSLLFFSHLSMSMAVGTSLAIISLNAFIGLMIQLHDLQKAHLEISVEIIAIFSVVGIIGGVLGNTYAKNASDRRLKHIFGFSVFLIGMYLLFSTVQAHFFT